jgi:hypothetical protein
MKTFERSLLKGIARYILIPRLHLVLRVRLNLSTDLWLATDFISAVRLQTATSIQPGGYPIIVRTSLPSAANQENDLILNCDETAWRCIQ